MLVFLGLSWVASHDPKSPARSLYNKGSYWLYKNYPCTQDSVMDHCITKDIVDSAKIILVPRIQLWITV